MTNATVYGLYFVRLPLFHCLATSQSIQYQDSLYIQNTEADPTTIMMHDLNLYQNMKYNHKTSVTRLLIPDKFYFDLPLDLKLLIRNPFFIGLGSIYLLHHYVEGNQGLGLSLFLLKKQFVRPKAVWSFCVMMLTWHRALFHQMYPQRESESSQSLLHQLDEYYNQHL